MEMPLRLLVGLIGIGDTGGHRQYLYLWPQNGAGDGQNRRKAEQLQKLRLFVHQMPQKQTAETPCPTDLHRANLGLRQRVQRPLEPRRLLLGEHSRSRTRYPSAAQSVDLFRRRLHFDPPVRVEVVVDGCSRSG